MWSRVVTPNSEFYVAVVYHPPNSDYLASDLVDHLIDSCEYILSSDPNAKIIIAGDVNTLDISDLTRQQLLTQVVKKPTRGENILDVFLTNSPLLFKKPVLATSFVRSDHKAILIFPKSVVKPIRKTVYIRDTREQHKVKMELKLKSNDWNINIEDCQDISSIVDDLNHKLWSMFDESFPLIKVKVSSRDPLHMTPLVKHLLKIRNKNIRNGSTDYILQARINELIRTNQRNAVNNENQKQSMGTRAWWNTVNQITGNRYHASVGYILILIKSIFPDTNLDQQYSMPELVPIPEDIRVPTIDEETVLQFLLKQKRTASGPDKFPYWFWRDFAYYLAPVITKLFNQSLKNQVVPTSWKLADLTPIPKESPVTACTQLRPISITDIVRQLFEKIVFKRN
mgnify:CR=1 FL=1